MKLSAVEISLCVARVTSIILKQRQSIFHQFFCSFEVDSNPRESADNLISLSAPQDEDVSSVSVCCSRNELYVEQHQNSSLHISAGCSVLPKHRDAGLC